MPLKPKPDYYQYNSKGELQPVYNGTRNGRYRFVDGKCVKVSDKAKMPSNFSGSDDMAPIQSMADGKTYDSKSAYYQSLKNQGRRIVETGEKMDSEPEYKVCEKDLASDIKQTMDQLGY